MALTASNMLPLGTTAPDFELPDTISDTKLSLNELKSEKATVIMFLCNHCPFVKHINEGLVTFTKEYIAKGVSFIAISSNDIETYPEDSPFRMKQVAADCGYTFPYLYDETQQIAKSYQAACTPDFYIFDKDLKCVYRGQMDSSRPSNNIPVTGNDLRAALDAVLSNQPVSSNQRPSQGCNIKWKNS